MNDAVTSYLERFEALRRNKRWGTDTTVLRFAAMALSSMDGSDIHARLESASEELRQGAGWSGPLRSPVRYVVAAMILRRGLGPVRVHSLVRQARDAMGERKLPRGALSRTLAALLLVLQGNGSAVPGRTLDRMAQILRRWKEDHRWLTGADDLPAAALHAAREESPDTIALHCERAYRALHAAGFHRGNQLQLVSHLLAFDSRGIDAAVQRFRTIAAELERRGQRVGSSVYDEVAILALTRGEPRDVVARVFEFRDRLREARPRPSKEIALSLATGLALGADLQTAGAPGPGAAELMQIRLVQALLDAQQAAMVAVIVASSAATSAASH